MKTLKNIFIPDWEYVSFAKDVGIPIVAWATVFIIITMSLGFIQSSYQAKVFNAQNGTNWTALDFFMAGDQINSNTQTVKLK